MLVVSPLLILTLNAVFARGDSQHLYQSRLSFFNPSARNPSLRRLDFSGGIPVFRSTLISSADSSPVQTVVRAPRRYVDLAQKRDIVIYSKPQKRINYRYGTSSGQERSFYPLESETNAYDNEENVDLREQQKYNYKIVSLESRVKAARVPAPTLPPPALPPQQFIRRKKKKKKIIYVPTADANSNFIPNNEIPLHRRPRLHRGFAPSPQSIARNMRQHRGIYSASASNRYSVPSPTPPPPLPAYGNQHTASLAAPTRLEPYPIFTPPATKPPAPEPIPFRPLPPTPPPQLAKLKLDESSVEVKPASYATPSVRYDIAPTVKPPPTQKPRSEKSFASFLTPFPAVVKKTTEAPTTKFFTSIPKMKLKKAKKKSITAASFRKSPTVIKPFATSKFEPISSLRPLATAKRNIEDNDDSVELVPLNIVSTTTASNGDSGSKVIHVTRKAPLTPHLTTPSPAMMRQPQPQKPGTKQKEQTKILLRMLNALKAKKENIMDQIRNEQGEDEDEDLAPALQQLRDLELNENTGDATYEYTYRDGLAGHSRSESRDGKQIRGQYKVALPDGRTQIVDYTADETGFHPVITYEEPALVQQIGLRY